MKILNGNALKYGDNINTDIISPPQYMELSIEEAAAYAMSAVDPDFSKRTKKGDIFVCRKICWAPAQQRDLALTLNIWDFLQ